MIRSVVWEDKAGGVVGEVTGISYREKNEKQSPWIGVKILLARPKTLMVVKERNEHVRNI